MSTSPAIVPSADEPLWTAQQVAAHLRVSRSMIYKLARNKRLPVIPIGALLRFNPDHVRAFARGELQAGALVALSARTVRRDRP